MIKVPHTELFAQSIKHHMNLVNRFLERIIDLILQPKNPNQTKKQQQRLNLDSQTKNIEQNQYHSIHNRKQLQFPLQQYIIFRNSLIPFQLWRYYFVHFCRYRYDKGQVKYVLSRIQEKHPYRID